jgi:hypothetical protein
MICKPCPYSFMGQGFSLILFDNKPKYLFEENHIAIVGASAPYKGVYLV